MKKKPNKAVALAWSNVTEIDFSAYRVRKNRFAKRIAKEGLELIHDGPSRASLTEIPEADFGQVRVRRSPYAARIKTSGLSLQVGKGRPKRGAETGPTVLKSLRLPSAVRKELERRARSEGVAVHALVRKAVLALLQSVA
ncbi:MAG TPA: hypothetical protein VNW92_10215 [Polyangiaceae bacterium]|jgi:hypothetical protein|nr:hypothetical protein [Polyangiaceae bacterium]